jgi:hypothetical protein
LLPLFSGDIEYVYLNDYSSCQLLVTIRDRFPTQFIGIKQLTVGADEGPMFQLLLQWLGTKRADGEPRKLKIFISATLGFVDSIRQVLFGFVLSLAKNRNSHSVTAIPQCHQPGQLLGARVRVHRQL